MKAPCAGRLHDFISAAAQRSDKVTRLLPPGTSRIRSAVGRGPSPSQRPLDGRKGAVGERVTPAAGATTAAPQRCAGRRAVLPHVGRGRVGTLASVGSLRGLCTSDLQGCCFSLAIGKFSALPFLNLFAVRDFKSNVFPHTFPEKADLHMH